MNHQLSLAEWRRTVSEMYTAVREAPEAGRLIAWQDWRARRNDLFKHHVQSPLDDGQRMGFQSLPYFSYDSTWRVEGTIDREVEKETFRVQLAADGVFSFTRIAQAHFTVNGHPGMLNLFWIEGYGGGLFLPFKDATNSQTTYGGGRYLYDTIKGADLGVFEQSTVLDFNFAYNPSCAYHPRWVCPLSPPENTLPFAIEAGEQSFHISM